MKSFGYLEAESEQGVGAGQAADGGPSDGDASPESVRSDQGAGTAEEGGPAEDTKGFWLSALRRNASSIGRWLATGIGGVLGALGGLIIGLAFLFYMLATRSEWVDRLQRAMAALGLRPGPQSFQKVRGEIVTFVGCLAMVSVAYSVLISLALWAIGVPQPLFWGVLTGLLEVVPYFGPLSAGTLTTIAALGAGDGLWAPVAVLVLFVVLQTLEGYVIAPMLYGKAVRIDPLTVLLGVLFFGWLWGPVGLALAMPMMIILRGLVAITPDVPAIDALVEDESAKAKVGAARA